MNWVQIAKLSFFIQRGLAFCLAVLSGFVVYHTWGGGSVVHWILFAASLLGFLIFAMVFFDDEVTPSDQMGWVVNLCFWGRPKVLLSQETYYAFCGKAKESPEARAKAINFLASIDKTKPFLEEDFRKFTRPGQKYPKVNVAGLFLPFLSTPQKISKEDISLVLAKKPKRLVEHSKKAHKFMAVFFGCLSVGLLAFWLQMELSLWSNLCFLLAAFLCLVAVLPQVFAPKILKFFGWSLKADFSEKAKARGFCMTYISGYEFDEANIESFELLDIQKMMRRERREKSFRDVSGKLEIPQHAVQRYLRNSGLWQEAEAFALQKSLGPADVLRSERRAPPKRKL